MQKEGMRMGTYALEVQSLTKKVRNKLIVDDVSFGVEKGEIFGLLGPNGAGKTTIIRMIVSLIARTKGKVLVNGKDLDGHYKEVMSEMGAIVENPEFYKYMSGYKNLKQYANMAGRQISPERIRAVTELVKLEDVIHNKVKTYSLGMRQRLGVAQALLHSPSVLILDEPTNGLDPQGIREFRDYLRQLADNGMSVIVSSHLLSEMELMCDRYAIIEKGKLIHVASMDESQGEEAAALMPVVFDVGDLQAAVQLVREQQPGAAIETVSEGQFILQARKEQIPETVRLLVNGNIDVYGVEKVTDTLEDRFLKLTGKGEVTKHVLTSEK